MRAPTIAELLSDIVVTQALEDIWRDSLPDDDINRHEEGGWIYMDATGAISVRRAASGGRAVIDLTNPPIVSGAFVVATIHTHPNPSDDGWDPGPSTADSRNASFFGVPFLIRADDGVRSTGPDSRRGGLTGNPGFPA